MESNKNYVIINNRAYDPVTGLPVDISVSQQSTPTPSISASQHHRNTNNTARAMQHSETLSRRYVKKPISLQTSDSTNSEPIVAAYSPVKISHSNTTSESVRKFAPTSAAPIAVSVKQNDLPAEKHPVAHRAQAQTSNTASIQRQRAATQQKQSVETRIQTSQPNTAQTLKPATVLKNEAILEAMNREIAPQKIGRTKKHHNTNRWSRFIGMATASLAVVMLAGYFTYLNMPNLNMRMAAIQSGVDAKYPGYSPDGYALNGPIQFKDGEVAMRFAYADGVQGFTLTQQKSNWDSSAVRQFVDTQSTDAITTQVDGLTIYTFGSNAAWVNGGILYTVNGDAPLSGEQIQRIATSI